MVTDRSVEQLVEQQAVAAAELVVLEEQVELVELADYRRRPWSNQMSSMETVTTVLVTHQCSEAK